MINEKGIIKEYDLIVYPLRFIVAIGDVEKEINTRYKPYEEEYNWLGAPKESYKASTYHVKFKKGGWYAILIWYSSIEDFTGETLTHECNHAALDVFNFIGAKIQYNDQEPFCYLSGNMARLANTVFYEYKDYLEKNKKKIKKNGKEAKDKQTGNP